MLQERQLEKGFSSVDQPDRTGPLYVIFFSICSAQLVTFSSQLEMSHVLNGKTPENQHGNRGAGRISSSKRIPFSKEF